MSVISIRPSRISKSPHVRHLGSLSACLFSHCKPIIRSICPMTTSITRQPFIIAHHVAKFPEPVIQHFFIDCSFVVPPDIVEDWPSLHTCHYGGKDEHQYGNVDDLKLIKPTTLTWILRSRLHEEYWPGSASIILGSPRICECLHVMS